METNGFQINVPPSYNFQLCRICLEAGENFRLMSIFESGGEICRKIYLCTGVQVCQRFLMKLTNDCNFVLAFQIVEMKAYGVPAFICIRCLKELGRSWNFRMAATTAEQHFKKKTFALECGIWKHNQPPSVTPVQPVQEEIVLLPETPQEEFTFTIKTEPEDFVFEPLESAINLNLEMLMDCPEGPILKFEGKDEKDVLEENFSNVLNEAFSKSTKVWECEICSRVSFVLPYINTGKVNIFL